MEMLVPVTSYVLGLCGSQWQTTLGSWHGKKCDFCFFRCVCYDKCLENTWQFMTEAERSCPEIPCRLVYSQLLAFHDILYLCVFVVSFTCLSVVHVCLVCLCSVNTHPLYAPARQQCVWWAQRRDGVDNNRGWVWGRGEGKWIKAVTGAEGGIGIRPGNWESGREGVCDYVTQRVVLVISSINHQIT